jgi:DNA-binding MarR family transcriptional regulator
MTDTVLEFLQKAYPDAAKELLPPLLQVMDEADRAFEGDLEKFHILLAIALRTAVHPDIALAASNLAAGQDVELPSLWTNVNSIAMSLGLPKETVRRKVNALIRKGWLERQDHSVRYTAKAARELAPVRDRILAMVVANYRTLDRALAPRPGAGLT